MLCIDTVIFILCRILEREWKINKSKESLMKKYLGLMLAVVLSAEMLAGCGPGGSSAESGTTSDKSKSAGGTTKDGKYDLVFWVYSDAVTNEQGELFDQWVEEYCEENPKVNSIKLVGKNDSDLLTALMSGVGLPDMFFAAARDMRQYMGAIDLLDLSSVFDSEDGYKDGFYEPAISAVSQEDGMWAMPFRSFVSIIFRNKDVMEKAGIDWKNESLYNWDVFFDECEKVKKSGIDVTHSWAQGGNFCPGAILGSDAENLTVGVKKGKTTVKLEQVVRTFETVKKMETYSNGMTYNDEAASEAFKAGELGFIALGPWNEPEYAQADTPYDVQLIPPYEKDGWTGGLQGWDFMYGVDSGDEGRNDAIRGWLKKMGSYDTHQENTQILQIC